MDEHKLTELFQSAVRDTPPASFDDKDVALAAGRITRRRRAMLTGGGSVAVVVLFLGLFLGTGGFGPRTGGSSSTGSAAGPAVLAPAQQSDSGASRLNGAPFSEKGPDAVNGFPSVSPMQGGGLSGKTGPGAGSTPQGCGPMDAELAVALANELSSVGARTSNPAGLSCPNGTRSATYSVTGGTVTALLVPAADASLVRMSGLVVSEAPAASGPWTVFVLTQPASGYAAGIASIEQAIAAKF